MCKKLFTLITLFSLVTMSLRASGLGLSPAANYHGDERSSSRNAGKKTCAACTANGQSNTPSDQLESLATLGNRSKVLSFVPVARSIFDGATVNFVGTATGNLAFAHTDLSLSGLMPIIFQRVYASDRDQDTGLGAGWSFVLDDRISLHGATATLETGSGSELSFRQSPGGSFVLETPQPDSHQSFDLVNPETITEQVNGLIRTYKKLGPSFRLSQITDRNGNNITIGFDSRLNIVRLSASGGAVLTLEWSQAKDARLVAVSDNTGRRISFKQDGNLLRRVTDPSGAYWAFDYQNGKLTRAADPEGRVLLRVNYDKAGRGVLVGDAVGMNRFVFEMGTDGVSKRTTVTDALGAQTIYEHNQLGALVGIKDDEGHSAHLELNAANRPTHIYDSSGAETRFSYDRENRLTSQVDSDGSRSTTTYDERGLIASTTAGSTRTEFTHDDRGNTISAVSNDPTQSFHVNFDHLGQRTSITSDSGNAVTFEYDPQGNEVSFTYAKSGRFETARDRAGNIVSRRMPSGTTYAYEYDARGMVKRQSNDKGQVVNFERDASGAPSRVRFGNEKWISATRDEAGRIVSLSSSLGKSRRFGYDSRGALKEYTDGHGLRKQLEYDHRGHLRQISDSNGNRTTISRDRQGHIERIARLDKQGNRYDYDPAGKLVAISRVRDGVSFERASYSSLDPGSGASRGFFDGGECFFGFEGDFGPGVDIGIEEPLSGGAFCSDPYFGLGGFFDPFMGLGGGDGLLAGEACYQCLARNRGTCESNYHACVLTSTGVAIAAAAACALVTATLGLILCLAAAAVAQQLAIQACQQVYNGCTAFARNYCPQCP